MAVRVAFHRSLDELWVKLADLAQRDAVAAQRSTLALLDANRQLAELVISEQSDTEALGSVIESQAIELVAREAPVASDLRLVLSSLPVSASLVRMGALAAHVARTTRLRAPDPVVTEPLRDVFAAMGETAFTMASDLTTALLERSIESAQSVRETDETMDELHRQMFATTLAPSWDYGIEAAIDAALLGRYFERFADQAVSSAERVQFILTGTRPGG